MEVGSKLSIKRMRKLHEPKNMDIATTLQDKKKSLVFAHNEVS